MRHVTQMTNVFRQYSAPHAEACQRPQIPDGGCASRRFAVVQSEKVRPIDNYNESPINNAVTIVICSTVDLRNGSSKPNVCLKDIENKSLHPRVRRVTQWQFLEQPPATHTHRLVCENNNRSGTNISVILHPFENKALTLLILSIFSSILLIRCWTSPTSQNSIFYSKANLGHRLWHKTS